MSNKFKVLYYVNQFFGQIGGEEKAGVAPTFEAKTIGPALGFNGLLEDEGEVIGTIICGDNYFNEHKEEALEYIRYTFISIYVNKDHKKQIGKRSIDKYSAIIG
ncbi:MAG: glycine/betaine/sarcosine/D-proline family reductase selenoprotein B [Tissierellia bacterium]|nr:glycine/betaine/sarcosine/D-proline family reductase selenoprotein B [Tissierellia bacterium]